MNKVIKFIRNIFKMSRRGVSACDDNPWMGLASYEDPGDSVDGNNFYGRAKESAEVFELIDNHLLITLYGKSGIGKTSLLNAGVFPRLRRENYLPVYIRLGSVIGDTFSKAVVKRIEGTIIEKYGVEAVEEIGDIPELTDTDSELFLWNYFARHRFYNKEKEIIFPVIVFDQFEEVLRSSLQNSSVLLNQLSFLLDKLNGAIGFADTDYRYDYNFRFVLSIREDELYRLEDLINRHYLPSLKQCRYRLENLTEAGAMEIVQKNGAGIIDRDETDVVARRIVDASKGKGEELISTNLLSLICARLFDMMRSRNAGSISLNLVNSYLEGNPFEEYYTDSVSRLSERERKYIEKNLITSDGRRGQIKESEIARNIKRYVDLLEGSTCILRRVKGPDGTDDRIELIHDGLCEIVSAHQLRRIEKKNCTIYGLLLLIVGALCLAVLRLGVGEGFLVEIFLHKTDFFPAFEIIMILLFPFVIGGIVFNSRLKGLLSCFLALLCCVTVGSYVFSDQPGIGQELQGLWKNVNQGTSLFQGISHRFLALSITLMITVAILSVVWETLYPAIFNFRRNAKEMDWIVFRKRLLRDVINDGGIKYLLSYLFLMVSFLWYIQFTCGRFFTTPDFVWCAFPMTLLFFLLLNQQPLDLIKRVSFWGYPLLVAILMILVFSKVKFTPIIGIGLGIVCLGVLWFCYNAYSPLQHSWRIILNFIFLCMVLYFQNGYDFNAISYRDVERAFPWKLVQIKYQGYKGLQYAANGDTLLIPEFLQVRDIDGLILDSTIKKDAFIRQLPSTPMSKKLVEFAQDNINKKLWFWPFGIQPFPDSNDELMLLISFYRDLEYSIGRIAASADCGVSKTDQVGAQVFYQLRNSIVRFCISGNEEYMLNIIPHLSRYEDQAVKDLEASLDILDENSAYMTEKQVAYFVQSLTRCLYMNMLKVGILGEKYVDVLRNVQILYTPIVLPELREGKMNISSGVNITLTLEGTSASNENSSYKNKINDTLDFSDLKPGTLYAFDKLFNLVCDGNKIISMNTLEDLTIIEMEHGFNKIITTTLDRLLPIIRQDVFNPYKGFLSEICRRLYVVGTFRCYDMSNYSDLPIITDGQEEYGFCNNLNKYMDTRNNSIKTARAKQVEIDSLIREIKKASVIR